MKKCIFSLAVLLIFIFLVACEFLTDNIRLNGSVEMQVEVNNKFDEPGVNIPSNYTYSVEGYVFNSILGRYELKYSVYSDTGELVKELHRFVNVVDTTAPTVEGVDRTIYAVGVEYDIGDFINDYSDNFCDKEAIVVIAKSDLYSDVASSKRISIEFKDTKDNVFVYQKVVQFKYDIDMLIKKYKEKGAYFESTSSTGDYVHIRVDEETSLSYYKSGGLHIVKKIQSNLASYASIQVSANLNSLNKATIDLHVSDNGTYSTIFAQIDTTSNYKTLNISSITSSINNLNLDTDIMLNELNINGLDVVKEFQSYSNYDWSKLYN